MIQQKESCFKVMIIPFIGEPPLLLEDKKFKALLPQRLFIKSSTHPVLRSPLWRREKSWTRLDKGNNSWTRLGIDMGGWGDNPHLLSQMYKNLSLNPTSLLDKNLRPSHPSQCIKYTSISHEQVCLFKTRGIVFKQKGFFHTPCTSQSISYP